MPLASFDCQITFYSQSPPNPGLITFTGTKRFSFLIPGYLHNSGAHRFPQRRIRNVQSFTGYPRLTLDFIWNGAQWEGFNFCFSRVFC